MSAEMLENFMVSGEECVTLYRSVNSRLLLVDVTKTDTEASPIPAPGLMRVTVFVCATGSISK